MEKVICDVCGIAYSETAAQCPVCGCARAEHGQTSACDTVQVGEESTYTATKGGRFSKSNVRKRLKAAQIQPVPLELPPRAPKIEEPEVNEEDEYDDEYDEDDDDDDDEMPATNRGLIVIVVLLLLAIIAVASYIAIVQLDIFGNGDSGRPSKNPTTSDVTTTPTDAPGVRIPCTGVELMDSEMTLGGSILTMQLSYAIDPIDTTDDLTFTSSDPSVATVDKNGNVTAVGDGEATITITCGDISKTCKVTCVMDGGNEPEVPDVPTEPVLKTYGTVTYEFLRIRQDAGTGYAEVGQLKKGDRVEILETKDVAGATWGRIDRGWICLTDYVKVETVSEIPGQQTPDEPEIPDTPAGDEAAYLIKINGAKPNYLHKNQANSAEVTQKVGGKFKLTLVDRELEQILTDVVWTFSDDTVCELDGNYVVGLKKGNCSITAEYKGESYLVYVIVTV